MRLLKLLLPLLLFSLISRAQDQPRFPQQMAYADYSYLYQVNVGSGKARLTDSSAYLEVGNRFGSKKGFLLPGGNKDSVRNPRNGTLFFDVPSQKPVYYDSASHKWIPWGNGGSNNSSDSLTLVRIDSAFHALSGKKVDSIGKNIAGDSIVYFIDGRRIAFKYGGISPADSIKFVNIINQLLNDTSDKWVSDFYVSSSLEADTLYKCKGGACTIAGVFQKPIAAKICDGYSGGLVTRRDTYVFDITPLDYYYINCKLYTSPGGMVNISPPDDSLDRRDVFYADTLGAVHVKEGIPSYTPVKPQIDPFSEFELTEVTVSPRVDGGVLGYNSVVVFDNNTGSEWIPVSKTGTITFSANNTNPVLTPPKSLSISSASNGTLIFPAPDVYTASDFSTLSLYPRLTVNFSKQQNIIATLYNAGAAVTKPVTISFVKNSLNVWQPAVVTMSQFSFTKGNQFDALRLTIAGNVTNPFYFDLIRFEGGIVQSGGSGNSSNPDAYKSVSGNAGSDAAVGLTNVAIKSPNGIIQTTAMKNPNGPGSLVLVEANRDTIKNIVQPGIDSIKANLANNIVDVYDSLNYHIKVFGDGRRQMWYDAGMLVQNAQIGGGTSPTDKLYLKNDTATRANNIVTWDYRDSSSKHVAPPWLSRVAGKIRLNFGGSYSEVTDSTGTGGIGSETDPLSVHLSDSASMLANYRHWLAGYLTKAVADGYYVSLAGSYSNPSWIASLAWGKITGAPSFLTTESDPVYSASSWFSTTNNAANWNTAYNKFIVSGSYSLGTLTLTRNDATTVTVSGFAAGGGGGAADTVSVYTTGATYTVPNSTNVLYVDPSTPRSTLTITFPASPSSSNKLEIYFGGTITSGNTVTDLTIAPNTGQGVIDANGTALGPVQAGEAIVYRYRPSTQKWYRQ